MIIIDCLQRTLVQMMGPPGPRARPKAAVWLQLALICALISCPTSHTDAQEDFISLVREGADLEHAGRLYWIQDSKDDLCVGEVGMMMPCGDANLWGVRGRKGSYTLELMSGKQLGPKWPYDDHKGSSECLARSRCFRSSSEVSLSGCNSCGAKGWNLEPNGKISQDKGRICLIREGRGVRTEKCSHPSAQNASSAFRLIEYRPFVERGGDDQPRRMITLEDNMIKDEDSGLKFPADMSLFLGESARDQVYMGGGAFRFFGINVYQVALYIEANRASASQELKPFAGLNRKELQSNETFYAAMMSRDDAIKYDRTIYVKLLIPLKASTVKGSLEDGWNMEPEAKKILLDASFKHAEATRCCSKGTELLFSWTKADVLEVRLNGRLVESFHDASLAHELFMNYVNDDPISPQAKKGFVAHYPELLQPNIRLQEFAGGHVRIPTSQPSSSSSSSSSEEEKQQKKKKDHDGEKKQRMMHDDDDDDISSSTKDAIIMEEGGSEGEVVIEKDAWFWTWLWGEVAERRSAEHRSYYAPRVEPEDLKAHKSLRRWVVSLLIAYGLLMLMSLPGSRRRFQERLRRGGGSMRALALERSKAEWDAYLRRLNEHR